MKLPKYLFIFFSIFFLSNAISQEEQKTIPDALKTEKIDQQFNILIDKSGRYQDYKVIKRIHIDKLKANTLDSLKTLTAKLNTSNQKISEQQVTINGLEEGLAKTNEKLANVTEEKDNMNFLGMAVTKSSYNTIMFSIIGVLILLLAIFIFKFKNSNAITIKAKKSLSEIEEEFEDHRRRSLEREQKVMRKLQDEINKQRKAGSQ